MHKPMMLFLSFNFFLTAMDDTAGAGFYAQLEALLRADYTACTGDTAKIPLKKLIGWKHFIDSMVDRPEYPAIAKEYRAKTGRSAVTDRPCAVVAWKWIQDSVAAEAARRAEVQRRLDAAIRAESLAVVNEAARLPRLPCDFAAIPFGINQRSFLWFARRLDIDTVVDAGRFLRSARVPVANRPFAAAFFFDARGSLYRYELEGTGFPAESLDRGARGDADLLAAYFERKIGAPPRQTNRVGRDEIKEDSLAICKVWSRPQWSVAVGLSTRRFRCYAKAVVMNAPLPND